MFPAVQPSPSGIRFKGRGFSEPVPFIHKLFPPVQGIYAILVPDNTCRPRPFRVIYFGEAGDVRQRVTNQHEKYSDWVREAGGSTMYVCYHHTGAMTDQQRKDAENELICHYNPACNVQKSYSNLRRSLLDR